MKTLFVALTVFFLFGGIISVGFLFRGYLGPNGKVIVELNKSQIQKYDENLTINSINKKTAELNLPFTRVNGEGISPMMLLNKKTYSKE